MKFVSDWISGFELCQRGLRGFELFDLLQEGVTARTDTGKKIIDIDSLGLKRYTYEEILSQVRGELEGCYKGKVRTSPNALNYMGKSMGKRNEWTFPTALQEAKWRYEQQLVNHPKIPDGCKAVSFNLSCNDNEAQRQVKEAWNFLFKVSDVNEFAQKHGYLLIREATEADHKAKEEAAEATKAKPTEQSNGDQKDPEKFVRNIISSIESDNEIGIRMPGKPKRVFNRESMKFSSYKKNATWRAFLKVLHSSDHYYRVSKTKKDLPDPDLNTIHRVRNEVADNERGTLRRINETLAKFINKEFGEEFGIEFPLNFKFFEPVPGLPRTYKPKFKISSSRANEQINSEYEEMSTGEILAKLEKYAKNGWSDKFQDLVTYALGDERLKESIEEKLRPLYKELLDKKEIMSDTGHNPNS